MAVEQTNSVRISIIICSWQAPATLDDALASIYKQKFEEPLDVVLVNNGFSSERAEGLLQSFPELTMVDEPTPGLTYARRTGFRTARGDFFVCIDDDNILGDGFLYALEQLVRQNPNLGCITPAVVPLWEKPQPKWVQTVGTMCLSYTTLHAPPETPDRKSKVWKNENLNGWPTPPGGGMIIHRALTEDYLNDKSSQRLRLGRNGNSLGGSEDQDIYYRVGRVGRDTALTEYLVVFHQIPVSRTKWSYLLKLNFRMTQDWAVLESLWMREENSFIGHSSSLPWQSRHLLKQSAKCLLGRVAPQHLFFIYVRYFGYIWGRLRSADSVS